MAELPIATQCGTGAPAGGVRDMPFPGFRPRIGVAGMTNGQVSSGPPSPAGDKPQRYNPRLSRAMPPAGAGTPRYENETWSLEVFGCGWRHPSPLDSRFRENDEFGGRG